MPHPTPGLSQAIKASSAITAGTLLLASVCNAEVLTTPDQQTAVAVTIYNQNLALVKDRRDISLKTVSYTHLTLPTICSV